MKNKCITFDHMVLKEKANKYFIEMCGNSLDIHRQDYECKDSKVHTIVSFFDLELISSNRFSIDGIEFSANIMSQMDKDDIVGIYGYMMTIPECNLNDIGMLETFYQDTWETACLDATRDILKEVLGGDMNGELYTNHGDVFISSAFGPGYYGMDISEVEKFFKLLDADEIGVKINQSGIMIPSKSNVGFYIVVNKKTKLPKDSCKSCIGNKDGCKFCKLGLEIK